MSELSRNADLTAYLSDEALAEKCCSDELAAAEMISRYIGFIRSRVSTVGSGVRGLISTEDLIQEGLMALVSAYSSYTSERGACFRTYASTCITNRIRDAIRKSGSIPVPIDDCELYNSQGSAGSPEDIIIGRENAAELYSNIVSHLSENEWAVFRLFILGLSYDNIALSLKVSVKSVDNAMQRVRRKLRFLFLQA